jgi:RecJ-like exonuclease
MSINDYERDSCVTCSVETFGVDMCNDCETVESVECPNCGDLTTPYQKYVDNMCERCNQEAMDNYEHESVALSRWFEANN